jgi:hypothetical protein
VTTERRAVGFINNKFQSIRGKTAVAYSRYNPGIILEGLRTIAESSVRTTGVPAEIQSRHLKKEKREKCLPLSGNVTPMPQ